MMSNSAEVVSKGVLEEQNLPISLADGKLTVFNVLTGLRNGRKRFVANDCLQAVTHSYQRLIRSAFRVHL